MTDGLQLARDIRGAIKDVAPPAIVVVGPDEWAALLKVAGPLNTITDTDDGATIFNLPVYGQRGAGWHVMNVPAQAHQSRYGKGKPVGLDDLERLHLWTAVGDPRTRDQKRRDDDQTKLIADLDRHASTIYSDHSQSDLWSTLIAARDAIKGATK